MSESANCNTNEKNEDRIWEMRVFECTSCNSRRSGQGRQHGEGNTRSRSKRSKEGIMLGQELPAEGRQVLRSPKCKYTDRLEKHQMINMTTGDSTKGSIKEMKIKRQFGVGKGDSNRRDLERLVFFLMKRGASGEF